MPNSQQWKDQGLQDYENDVDDELSALAEEDAEIAEMHEDIEMADLRQAIEDFDETYEDYRRGRLPDG